MEVVEESKRYEDMWCCVERVRVRNIGEDAEAKELLSGLCPSCYRRVSECKCGEKKAISEVSRSAGRGVWA